MKIGRTIKIAGLVLGASVALLSFDARAEGGSQESIYKSYVSGLQLMGQQSLVVLLQAMEMIGTFMDAETTLETQRDLQVLNAEAHKDYHPSEQMCRIGTFVRSVAKTEEKANFDQRALNTQLMDAYTNKAGAVTAEGGVSDMPSRLAQFRTTYCDPADNDNGLSYMCDRDQKRGGEAGAEKNMRINKDIDYARTVSAPLTLDINFADEDLSDTEEDVIALARNLYWPESFNKETPEDVWRAEHKYLARRTVMAMNNVAHNSYTNIVGMKASAARDEKGAAEKSGWNYMKGFMRDFGLSDEEIHAYLGDYPSYHAQMEVMTKKLYQSPDFYTNLYDKPVNVARIGASMEAIKLMQGRDHLKSALRREMLTSLLVEEALAKYVAKLGIDMDTAAGQ